jgi:hypothetical protein
MTNAETNDTAATVAAQGATVAPGKTSSKKAAKLTKGAPKGEKTTRAAKPRKPAKTDKNPASRATGRTQSKGARILEMIGRAKGASLAEILTATGWQAHSVRGFISTAGKKHGVKIESLKNEAGDRIYRITK